MMKIGKKFFSNMSSGFRDIQVSTVAMATIFVQRKNGIFALFSTKSLISSLIVKYNMQLF